MSSILKVVADALGFVADDDGEDDEKSLGEVIEEYVEDTFSMFRKNRTGPPKRSNLKRHNLQMPERYPHRRVRVVGPPFEGERVELGES